jgi:hypothetical protein
MKRSLNMLAALLAVTAMAAAASAGAALATPLGGINIPGLRDNSVPADADHVIAEAKRLHAKIVRTDLPWSVLEPTGPTLDGQALLYIDRLLADAKAAGIAVSATVASTPCWESSAPAALVAECRAGHSEKADSWQPKDPASYAQVVGALAQRYAGQLYAIEVWNEPDQANEDYWAGPGKAEHYAQMLRAAYPAIKAAAPQMNVLGGSLVGSNGGFLKALYAAGIKGYYDGLSVHYYNLTLGSLRAIRETQTANGDSKRLWLDEFGWTSCWPAHRVQEEQACVTKSTQALNLRDSIREMSRVPYIAAEEVYKLQDSGGEDFGALSGSGARKPSFTALSEAFQHPTGQFSRITLSLRRNGSHVTASGSGPVGDFMQLEVLVGGRLRFRALFTQDRFNRYSVTLPSVLGTRALRVRVFQYWTGPSRAASASL